MPENKIVANFKDTKEVLSLMIGLSKAIVKSREDGKWDFIDVANFMPVLFTIGPALEGIDNVEIELRMANAEEANELKAFVKENVTGLTTDAQIDNFIKDCFAVLVDLWMVIKTYFLKPIEPQAKVENNPVSNNETV